MGMTSGQRLSEALSHREPDRVPYTLGATMHPARELGLSLEQYFSRPRNAVEGQLRLREKYGNDMLSCYPFAAVEVLPWGGEVIYFEQGPPNAGEPIIKKPEDILALEPPDVDADPTLRGVLEATAELKSLVGDEIPIGGVIVSPFSLPIMQMGFEAYLELIYQRPDLLERLLRVNSHYCVAWANAQLKAGASAILCYDPASSPTIISPDIVHAHGLPADKAVFERIEGSVMVHFASGHGLPLVEEVVKLGAVGMSASSDEDLSELKRACRGRLALVGNLNGLDMLNWSQSQAEAEVKRAIAQAGPGGGFVLSDNHGEIPFLVEEDVLLAMAEAVRQWGRYPLDWVEADGC